MFTDDHSLKNTVNGFRLSQVKKMIKSKQTFKRGASKSSAWVSLKPPRLDLQIGVRCALKL